MKTSVPKSSHHVAKSLIPGRRAGLAVVALVAAALPFAAPAEPLASGLAGSVGSTVGPDRAIYVAEGAAGRISRVDRHTGQVTTFFEGLPAGNPMIGLGGPIDLVFVGKKAYVLVTLVDPTVGGSDVNGIYRIDGPGKYSVVADLGTWSQDHPPATPFDLPQGVQYAIERYQDGFLVTDGHHNRVLQVQRKAKHGYSIRRFKSFGNIVPTGLDTWGRYAVMAQAGPVPHAPEDGKIVMFARHTPKLVLASGAPLLVDVEFGRGRTLYGLAQGDFPPPPYPPAGAPALPNTGSLVEADLDTGALNVIAEGLNLPSSLEIVQDAAYVVTLTGEVWKFPNLSAAP